MVFIYDFVLAVIPFLYYYNSNNNGNSDNTQYKEIDQYEMYNINESDSESGNSISSDNSNKFSKPKQKRFVFRFFVQPFISFASNPYLFYPYHFFYLYNLIGPQIFGNLMSTGNTYSERFVMAFLHGVIADGQRVNYTDGYFYLMKDLLKVQPILLLQIIYLNHCQCRQFVSSIILHLLLILYCISSRYKVFIAYGALRLFTSPFYFWFLIWEIISIIVLLINNYRKYPSNYRKFFKII